jgi:hypothetical protein
MLSLNPSKRTPPRADTVENLEDDGAGWLPRAPILEELVDKLTLPHEHLSRRLAGDEARMWYGLKFPHRTFPPQPSALYHLPSTLNPQPSTLNPQPSTLNPQPSTLYHLPSTLDPQPEETFRC